MFHWAAPRALRRWPRPGPSPAARAKAATKRSQDGLPVHSFRSLLADLATLTRNTVRFGKGHTMEMLATPTPLQQRILDLLGVTSAR